MQAVITGIRFGLLLLGSYSAISDAATPIGHIPCVDAANISLRDERIDGLKFVNGRACTSDEGLPDKCDWEHKIIRHEILKLAPDTRLLLVVINANHLTGSGAWDSVIVFSCSNGYLQKLFEKSYLHGATIEVGPNGELILKSGNWKPNDPACCPSGSKREVYRLNQSTHTYVLFSTEVTGKK